MVSYLEAKFRLANWQRNLRAALFRQMRINSGFSSLATLANLEQQIHHDICGQLYDRHGRLTNDDRPATRGEIRLSLHQIRTQMLFRQAFRPRLRKTCEGMEKAAS